MISFNTIKISAITILTTLSISVGLDSYFTLSYIESFQKEIQLEGRDKANELEAVRENIYNADVYFTEILLERGTPISSVIKELNSARKKLKNILELRKGSNRSDIKKLLIQIQKFKTAAHSYSVATNISIVDSEASRYLQLAVEIANKIQQKILFLVSNIRENNSIAENTLAQNIRNKKENNQYKIGFSIILAFLIWLFMSIAMSKPIKALVLGTSKIAEGDYNHRVPKLGKDSFGKLSDSFNHMAEKLGKIEEETTLRQNAELATQEAENAKEYVDNIIQSLSELLFVVDSKHIITKINQSVVHTTGYSQKKILNSHISDFICGKNKGKRRQIFDSFISDVYAKKVCSMEMITVADETISLMFSGTKFKDPGTGDLGLILTVKDMSASMVLEQMKNSLEDELAETQLQLVESAKLSSLGEMAAE